MAENGTFAERIEATTALPGVPTSPALAAGMGATPDEAKMIGTPAQKQASLASRIQSAQPQAQELFRAQRLTPEVREPTVEEAMEKERQEKLAGLGNLGQAIQSTIARNIQQATAAAPGEAEVEESVLATKLGLTGPALAAAKADPASNYNTVTSALNKFLASGNANDIEAAMATIDNLQLAGLTSADARELVGLTQASMAAQTGQVIAENVMDQVTMGSLDLEQLGFGGIQEVAATLGMDAAELSALTTDEFADRIRDIQKSEFSRVEKVKAELAAAPVGSLRREALLAELRDLGQAGVTGVEGEIVETVEDIDLAGVVQVGDEHIPVAQLLDDEQLSERIIDYINEPDPAKREAILPEDQFPGMVAWIRTNQEALGQLSQTAQDTSEVFAQANTENQNLNVLEDLDISLSPDVMAAVLPDWDPSKKVTSEQMADLKAKLSSSLIGEIGTLNESDEDKKLLLSKINRLQGEELDEVLGGSWQFLASETAEVVRRNPALADFLGLDPSQDFIFDEDLQEQIDQYDEVLTRVAEEQPTWLAETGIVGEGIRSLSPEELRRLSDNPENFRTFKDHLLTEERIEAAETVDDQLKILLNDQDVTMDEIEARFQEAKKWAELGDPAAIARRDEIARGIFEHFDPGLQSVYDIPTNVIGKLSRDFSGSLDEALAGNDTTSRFSDNKQKLQGARDTLFLSDEFSRYRGEIEDGVIDLADLQGLSREDQERLGRLADSQDGIRVDLDGFSSFADYQAAEAQKADRGLMREFQGTLKVGRGLPFNNSLNYDMWFEEVMSGVPTQNDVTMIDQAINFIQAKALTAENISDTLRGQYRDWLNTAIRQKGEMARRVGADAPPVSGIAEAIAASTASAPGQLAIDTTGRTIRGALPGRVEEFSEEEIAAMEETQRTTGIAQAAREATRPRRRVIDPAIVFGD